MRLKDKVAIVTGSSKGLGKVIAITMLEEGARVVINGTDDKALKKTSEEIKQSGYPVLSVRADVSDKKQVEEMVQKTIDEFGRIDILVNNAGGGLHTPSNIEEVKEQDWDKVLNVNLKGAFLCSQAVIAQMKRQKSGGKIVNISAMAGRTYATLAGVQYASAKAGIGGLTRQIAYEAGPYGINVNAIAPTVMLTGERVQGLWEAKTEEEKKKVIESIPLRRLADPKEIARVVVFLASDDASYITGVTLDVNGGRFMC